MKWINIESLVVDSDSVRTLNEIAKKEFELDFNNIPPIKIDRNGKILDGVKRYIVLIKHNFVQVPVIQDNIGKKIHVELNLDSITDYQFAA